MKHPGARVVCAPPSAHEVRGSDPAGSGIHLITVQHFIAQCHPLLPFHYLSVAYVMLKGM